MYVVPFYSQYQADLNIDANDLWKRFLVDRYVPNQDTSKYYHAVAHTNEYGQLEEAIAISNMFNVAIMLYQPWDTPIDIRPSNSSPIVFNHIPLNYDIRLIVPINMVPPVITANAYSHYRIAIMDQHDVSYYALPPPPVTDNTWQVDMFHPSLLLSDPPSIQDIIF